MSSLVALFHNRWSVPILAELHRRRGSRFVTLARTLGMSRESLRRTLAALIAGGLVGRNPGYGHPLRPEYVLTRAGESLARACEPLVQQLREDDLEDVGLKKWSMPVVFALAEGPRRFSELRERLEGISPRALTLALKDLEAAGLVDRRVTDDYPPATVYRLTSGGRPLATLLGQVAAQTIRTATPHVSSTSP
jgi:DNA-binding HxlR family transcriptional regulator